MSIQLSLFDDDVFDDDRPLPLIVAEKWKFPLQHIVVERIYRYAVQDWVQGLTGSTGSALRENVRRLLNNLDLGLNVTVQPYRATNGKIYQIPFVTDEDLYRIAQTLRPLDTRRKLGEVHAAILKYLAQAGVLADEFRRNPRRSAQRLEEIADRKDWGEAAKISHETHEPEYGRLTNNMYSILFGAAKSELVKELGLDYRQAKNFRDHLSELARRAIQAAEAGSAAQMRPLRGLDTDEQIRIVQQHARIFAPAFAQSAAAAGIDLLSGEEGHGLLSAA